MAEKRGSICLFIRWASSDGGEASAIEADLQRLFSERLPIPLVWNSPGPAPALTETPLLIGRTPPPSTQGEAGAPPCCWPFNSEELLRCQQEEEKPAPMATRRLRSRVIHGEEELLIPDAESGEFRSARLYRLEEMLTSRSPGACCRQLLRIGRGKRPAALVWTLYTPETPLKVTRQLTKLKASRVKRLTGLFTAFPEWLETLPRDRADNRGILEWKSPAAEFWNLSPGERSFSPREPASRAIMNERTLIAHMPGDVDLSDGSNHLHFNEGTILQVTGENGAKLAAPPAPPGIAAGKPRFRVKNTSTFSIEERFCRGLRCYSRFEPDGNAPGDITVDYLLTDKLPTPLVSVHVRFPGIEESRMVGGYNLLELPLMVIPPEGIRITGRIPEKGPQPESRYSYRLLPGEGVRTLPGRDFSFTAGDTVFRLSYLAYPSETTPRLPIRGRNTEKGCLLYLNPGGSYEPIPARCISQWEEQFSLTFAFRSAPLEIPEELRRNSEIAPTGGLRCCR